MSIYPLSLDTDTGAAPVENNEVLKVSEEERGGGNPLTFSGAPLKRVNVETDVAGRSHPVALDFEKIGTMLERMTASRSNINNVREMVLSIQRHPVAADLNEEKLLLLAIGGRRFWALRGLYTDYSLPSVVYGGKRYQDRNYY
ncbi:hypothetical protein PsorP6_005718 [Peronosclerospora sorghi]|uniref:Uncharacterized protein n=1 Tax=Peronosclerospora sorghi TaxID=230839 RepID=A0ACC0W370_9STRA|nr:hypothetical protein PsorP6_005718 [Peronosclerospora sorghi]